MPKCQFNWSKNMILIKFKSQIKCLNNIICITAKTLMKGIKIVKLPLKTYILYIQSYHKNLILDKIGKDG